MKKVIVVTRAFRYEPIVEKSIESVLNQTYADFLYYVWVSEDTRPTVQRYVEKDVRVHLLSQEEWPDGSRFCDIFTNLIKRERADYLCVLDADDLLRQDFLEKMVAFLESNQLDIAFCDRAYFMSDQQVYYKKQRGEDVIAVNHEEMRAKFCELYLGIRTVWGTLFTAKSLLQSDYSYLPENPRMRCYGGDTMLILTILRSCKRVGLLREELYLYNINQGISRSYFEERRDADVFLFRFAKSYLRDIDADSEENTHFLYAVLFNAIEDTFKVILNSDKDIPQKLRDIAHICKYQEVQDALDRAKAKYDYKEGVDSPLKLVFEGVNLNGELSREDYLNLVSIYQAYNIKLRFMDLSEYFTEWITDVAGLEHLYKKNVEYSVMYLLVHLPIMSERKRVEALYLTDQLCDSLWIKKYFSNYLFVCEARMVLLQIFMQNEERFLHELEQQLEKKTEFLSMYIELYKDYAATVGKEELYVDAWILQIEYMIAVGEFEDAKREMAEVLEIGIESDRVRELANKLFEDS